MEVHKHIKWTNTDTSHKPLCGIKLSLWLAALCDDNSSDGGSLCLTVEAAVSVPRSGLLPTVNTQHRHHHLTLIQTCLGGQLLHMTSSTSSRHVVVVTNV